MAKIEILSAGPVGGGTPVAGSGTANTIAMWTGSNAIGNSVITQDTGAITIGTAGGSVAHTINGTTLRCVAVNATDTFAIHRSSSSTGALRLVGGSGVASGNIILYGSSHATLAEAVQILNNNFTSIDIRADGIPNMPQGMRTKYSTANTANPPTDAELDSAFGAPATLGSGFIGVLNDNGGGTNSYIVWTAGTVWFYAAGTVAA